MTGGAAGRLNLDPDPDLGPDLEVDLHLGLDLDLDVGLVTLGTVRVAGVYLLPGSSLPSFRRSVLSWLAMDVEVDAAWTWTQAQPVKNPPCLPAVHDHDHVDDHVHVSYGGLSRKLDFRSEQNLPAQAGGGR